MTQWAWQPIETAEPETSLLLWEPHLWKVIPDSGIVVIGYYDTDLEAWRDINGYELEPTHWMAIPEGPK
jgi:hypothetical protein